MATIPRSHDFLSLAPPNPKSERKDIIALENGRWEAFQRLKAWLLAAVPEKKRRLLYWVGVSGREIWQP
jgi:hypothetical protein